MEADPFELCLGERARSLSQTPDYFAESAQVM